MRQKRERKRRNKERDLEIVARFNGGASYGTIRHELSVTRSMVAAAIRDARLRGEHVRTGERRVNKKFARVQRANCVAQTRRRGAAKSAHRKISREQETFTSAESYAELHAQLRAARQGHTSRSLNARLPARSSQCRWLNGDILDGTLRACRRTRMHKELPVLSDPMPYCKHHRKQAILARPTRAEAAPRKRTRVIQSRYGFTYYAAA